jgi:hypothetical protein
MPVDPTRKGFGPLYLTLAVMFACALVLLTDAKCHGQNKPEEASFRIDVPGPGGGMSSGSGTGISEHLVLTNNHVGKALDTRVVVWHAFSRKRWDGIVVSVYPQADLALVYVAEGGLPWVTINGDGLKAGEAVYACGYGSNAILRRGEGVVTQVTGRRGEQVSVWDTGLDIEPGDSGSGIFNQAGELVGVNWGEDVHVQRNAATSATHVVELCNHFQETQCGGGGCQMGGFPRSGGMGGGQMLPVRPPVASEAAPAVPARPPVVASPAAPAAPGIDAEKLAATLIEKLAGDERFKGPKGERGEPGPTPRSITTGSWPRWSPESITRGWPAWCGSTRRACPPPHSTSSSSPIRTLPTGRASRASSPGRVRPITGSTSSGPQRAATSASSPRSSGTRTECPSARCAARTR